MIRVTEGDQVRIIVKNELDDPTTIHWHGVEVPNAMDGVPGVTQDPIQPGETFTYEFTARPAGTFMYHSHFEGDIQVSAGLYAPFIIDPKEPASLPDIDITLMISEWLFRDGHTYAAMPMGGMEPNSLNGKAFLLRPSTSRKASSFVYGYRHRAFVHPCIYTGCPSRLSPRMGILYQKRLS
jgi:FtsP/CotA-like multicopper oxidase with cupredoxin domain